MSKPQITESEWLEHYQKANALKISLSRYAQDHNLPKPSLYSAVNRLRRKGLLEGANKPKSEMPPTFVKAALESGAPYDARAMAAKVALPSGVMLELQTSEAPILVETLVLLQKALDNNV